MSSDHPPTEVRGSSALLHKFNSALSADFCPALNRYVYWLKSPFWVLVLAMAGSIVCGIFLNPLVFVLTATLVFVTGIGVALPWIAVKAIHCRVAFDVRRTRVGHPAIIRLTVQNRWPVPVWGLSLIRGFAVDAQADDDEGIALARVPGWSTVEYSWPFEPRRRGVYPNDVAEVETAFPFGLFRARRQASVDGQLVVWPQTVRLDGMPDAAESDQAEELCSDRRAGEFGDMMGTRPFRNGDSLRRVHWSQTARQQTLIVTERQAPAMTSVRLVVDVSQTSHTNDDAEQTVDQCVQVVASLCESLHRQHARVEVALGVELFVVSESAASFNRTMDALATADVSSAPTPASSRFGSFEIRVTTPAGADPKHPRQIVVDADRGGSETRQEFRLSSPESPKVLTTSSTADADSCPVDVNAWIELESRESIVTRFPDLWRRACHVG